MQWGHKNFPNGIFFALMESRYWRAINQTQKVKRSPHCRIALRRSRRAAKRLTRHHCRLLSR